VSTEAISGAEVCELANTRSNCHSDPKDHPVHFWVSALGMARALMEFWDRRRRRQFPFYIMALLVEILRLEMHLPPGHRERLTRL
jgi:hypothetical protein